DSGSQTRAEVTRYPPQFPPAIFGPAAAHATRLPASIRAMIPPPDATTVPLPSKPGMAGSGFLNPYNPRTNIRSDGLMGEAAILISTSPGPGDGTGTRANDKLSGWPS